MLLFTLSQARAPLPERGLILVTALAMSVVGDGLRVALDPRMTV